MMKLSTMKRVCGTVDQEWRSPLGEKILERWGYDEGSVYFFRASANFVFIFKKSGKTHFLRFNDSIERQMETIEGEIMVLQYLQEKGIPVNRPIKSNSGNYLEVVETDLGIFYATVFEGVEGKQLEINELTEEQIFLWGSTLGKLHEALKQMPEEYRSRRSTWLEELRKVEERFTDFDVAGKQELERIVKWAEGLDVSSQNYGLIHYDFELDNVLFKEGMFSIVDFDDSANYWYVADIPYALRDLGKFDLESPFLMKFLEGYTSETELDYELLKEQNMFMRLHNLVSYGRLVWSVDKEDSPEDPQWLIGLRKKLVDIMEKYRSSFEKLKQ